MLQFSSTFTFFQCIQVGIMVCGATKIAAFEKKKIFNPKQDHIPLSYAFSITYMQTHSQLIIEPQLFPLKVHLTRRRTFDYEYFVFSDKSSTDSYSVSECLEYKVKIIMVLTFLTPNQTRKTTITEKKTKRINLESCIRSVSVSVLWLRNNCFHYYCYQLNGGHFSSSWLNEK